MLESGVTAKGQTTLPRDVRAALDVAPGDRVRYLLLDGGEVRILKLRPVTGLAGVLKAPRSVSLDEMETAISDARGT